MLLRFEPTTFAFDPNGEYLTGTIDENGAQALVWAAMSRAFTVAENKLPEGPEAGLLEHLPVEYDDPIQITESQAGWRQIESLLAAYGKEVNSAIATPNNPAVPRQRSEQWPLVLRQDVRKIGAWATGLSLEIRLEQQSLRRARAAADRTRGDKT